MTEASVLLPESRTRALGLRLLSDERLAALAGRGDRQAFAVVYERYQPPLYRYCRSILTDPEDASDALQNTMLGAFKALSRTRKDIALKPWLFRIAHNESISLLRRRRPQAELTDTFESHGPSVEGLADTNERLRELVADLAELSERQRGALVMRELNGLAYDEVGLALEMSPAAAKQTVFEAHAALNEQVEGRAMDCEAIRRSLSVGDRRLLRGRKVRAHLRHCSSCEGFKSSLEIRRADLAALAPPLPVATAASLFESLFGGGGGDPGGGDGGLLATVLGGGAAAGGGAGGSGGLFAGLSGGGGGFFGGLTGGGGVVASSATVKAMVPVAVGITVGAGTLGLGDGPPAAERVSRPAAQASGLMPPTMADRRSPFERAVSEVQARRRFAAALVTGGIGAPEAAAEAAPDAPDQSAEGEAVPATSVDQKGVQPAGPPTGDLPTASPIAPAAGTEFASNSPGGLAGPMVLPVSALEDGPGPPIADAPVAAAPEPGTDSTVPAPALDVDKLGGDAAGRPGQFPAPDPIQSGADLGEEIEEPGDGEPGSEDPGEDPGSEDPGSEDPGSEDPGTEDPGGEDPGAEEPGTEEPGPGGEEPPAPEPDTGEPGVEDPGDEGDEPPAAPGELLAEEPPSPPAVPGALAPGADG